MRYNRTPPRILECSSIAISICRLSQEQQPAELVPGRP